MPLVPALEALAAVRTNQVVVTSMGAAREWPKLSRHPLDFHYLPSAMGQVPALALGLAVARPDSEVW
jgi:thiamine pyrophosphate-dependent acetolactate synthase large subunit-like protein